MKYQLQNEKIIVTVASKGAEMQSMIKDGQEYLWNGNIKLERKSTRWGSMDLPKTVSSPL